MATLDEAVNLRENGVKKPILVLGYVDPYEFDILVSHEITATVFDVETAQLLADAARVQKKQAHCHIKVDTGMRRIGLEPDENGIAIVKQITALKELSADGIFTHFAASDETDKTSAEHQFKLFTDFIGRLEKEGILKGFHAEVNYEAFGYGIKAFINLSVEPYQKKEFYPFIQSVPNVIECNCVTGDYSMLIEVAYQSTVELDHFINELQQFGRTKTQIVFSTSVEQREVPIVMDEK